jgi:hypothetical protein
VHLARIKAPTVLRTLQPPADDTDKDKDEIKKIFAGKWFRVDALFS